MSKCTQGVSSTNSSSINAAVIAPPNLPPVFFMSAMLDFIKDL